MLTFESDYTEGAAPQILDALVKTNYEQVSGYGHDKFCDSAKEKIKAACKKDDVQVSFITGGTQTNQLIIDSVLKPYEGVVAASTGHVNCHEAGAIEYTGHKVLPLPQYNGKIKAQDLKKFVQDFYEDGNAEHMIYPGMVYISHPTEYGTLYSVEELKAIHTICSAYKMPLFLDGARLGYGLMSSDTDVKLEDIARLTDIFYIGGTKVGALCGEAVVFTHNNRPEHFENLTKKHGALLAKGRLLGVQFDTLFTDKLYFNLAKNAIEQADFLKAELAKRGFKFFLDSPTNQQFIVIENSKMAELKKYCGFGFWEKYDDTHTVIRFATSWATTRENVLELLQILDKVCA